MSAPARLEDELDALLLVERFAPPAEFSPRGRATHPPVFDDAKAFWAQAARRLRWRTPWTEVHDDADAPFHGWFAGGRLNASENCLDRHVEAGRGDRVAFHWNGEGGEHRAITYTALLHDVEHFAGALLAAGVRKGDVVGVYLPMVPEAVVAMLACARIGAVHNVVFGGFAPEAVRERLAFSGARALVTADGARRKGRTTPVKALLDPLLEDLPDLATVFVVRCVGEPCDLRGDRDVWFADALAAAAPADPVPVDAEDPLFILYTSGSTAKPKGIVHSTGGYLTGVAETAATVLDLDPDEDVYWCTADLGWITAHSYVVYGPLMHGVTSVMYEGAPDHPHKSIWWELVERHRVSVLYTAPTAIRACMKWGADLPLRHDLSSLRLLATAGEPINPKAWVWYHHVVGGGRCPVVDTWWQTETGHIMISALPGRTATKPGAAMQPVPGVTVDVVDEAGTPVREGSGLLVVRGSWPGMLRTLYREPERYVETYFGRFGPHTYVAGDAARRDADGDVWIIGRTDDVLNVSGHRISTAEIESALVGHPSVAEAAVVGRGDAVTGEAVLAFVTLRDGGEGSEDLAAELRDRVATRIGKLARPGAIVWADDLPKTRSGKIMRRLLRDIAEGRPAGDTTTLVEPATLDVLREQIVDEAG